jgi:hypothetical protein
VQHLKGLRTEGAVDVDAHDLPGGPDALGELSHRLAGAAPGIQATGAATELDLIEQPPGGVLPDAGLGLKALIFLFGAS